MKIKRRSLHLFQAWVVRIAISIILFGCYFFYSETDVFTITTYELQGVDEVSRASIIPSLEKLGMEKTFFVIPKNKIFTYSASGITSVVRDTIGDLKSISIRPIGLHTIHIQVELLTPLLRLEGAEAISSDGTVFATSKDLSSYPRIIISSSTKVLVKRDGLLFTELTFHEEKINETFLLNIVSISTKVSSLIFPVDTILVEEIGDVTFFNASGTSKVMVLRDADPKKTWSTIVSAIDTNPLKTKLGTNKEGLLYLDARYGNKVFYRFNDMAFENTKGAAILRDHASTTQTASTTPQ